MRIPGKHALSASGLVGAALMCASPAGAAPITTTINSVDGDWISASGTSVSGLNSNEIRWGTPAVSGGNQSGYRFDGIAPPQQGPFTAGTAFDLGTFTHFNNPITLSGGSITQATLDVTINADITNGSTQNETLTS